MDRVKLPTLLAVTSNPSVRCWIKQQLDHEFFIIEAAKKRVVIESANTSSLDFIIIDSKFEDCDSLELCAELKQILRTLTPILLITGRLKRSFLDAALEAGVTDFLSNQLDPEELQMRIATIRKSQSLREKTQGASKALTKLKEESSNDDLKNRIFLHNQALKMMKEEGASFIALMISIDHFAEIQTRIGYLAMQHMWLSCMDWIKKKFSQADLFIPSSDGRCIMLFKNIDQKNARQLAERLRKEIIKTRFDTPSGPIQITLSIAISSLKGTESDFNRMIESSSKALKTANDLIISIEKESL